MKPISAAKAALRDQSRDTDGQFGIQDHAESGEVQTDHLLSIPEGFTWRGLNVDGVSEWGRTTPEGDETITASPFDGSYRRYLNGALHRTDGPAVTYPDGEDQFWQSGQLHCTTGPAIRRPGDALDEFFIEGVECLPADICTATPKAAIGYMDSLARRDRLDKFTGWDPGDSANFRTQIQIIADAILSVSHGYETAPFVDFPTGSESTPFVGFNRGNFIVAQYTNFEELSDDHDAVGVDQAMAIASAILNKRNHMVAEYNTANPPIHHAVYATA